MFQRFNIFKSATNRATATMVIATVALKLFPIEIMDGLAKFPKMFDLKSKDDLDYSKIENGTYANHPSMQKPRAPK